MSDSRSSSNRSSRSSSAGGARRAAGVRRAPSGRRRRTEADDPVKGTSRTGRAEGAGSAAGHGGSAKGAENPLAADAKNAAATLAAAKAASPVFVGGGKSADSEDSGATSTAASADAAAGAAAGGAAASGAKPRTRKAGARANAKPTGRAAAKPAARRSGAAAGAGGAARAGGKGRAGAGGKGRAGRAKPKNWLNYPRAGARGPWRWLPSFRMIAGAMAIGVLAMLGLVTWLYSTTDVPEASAVATAQTTRVYFADGKTEMGRFSEYDRTILPSDQIPQTVKDAVVASEDSTFYENRGISPRGIIRAVINNVAGGARQGGSTITQQYVERYHTGTNTSYVGKVREMVMAVKIDQELSKDEILTRYLNTIYFGRGAYGVQAASQAYFGKDAKDLDASEAALLVAVIPAPSSYDPARNPQKAAGLWDRVISREVNETQALTRAEADALEFPKTKERKRHNPYTGTNGYLLNSVHRELVKQGFTEEEISTGGYRIVSTFDVRMQKNTVKAIDDLGPRPENNRIGTVTIDPATGAVKAMYGGADYVKQSRNDANQSRMQAGSIFKTFTLIAALEDGQGLSTQLDGNSPQTFRGGWKVKNFNDRSYGTVDLKKATANSINTAYAELNLDIGPKRTKETAIKLGLPEKTPGLTGDAANVLGTASPTVQEMGEVYATIASGGIHRPTYVVQQVKNSDGSVAYEHKKKDKRAFDEDVAINATVALQGPPTVGSARKLEGIMDGRPVAGKTGTSESFRSAWFVGFTPQLVTSVGMFQPSADGRSEEPLQPFGGEEHITGSTFPTQIWGDIMSRDLEGQEKLDFPEQTRLDNQKRTKRKHRSSDSSGDSSSSDSSGSERKRDRTPEPTPEPTPQPTTQAPAPQPAPKPTTQAPAPKPTPQEPKQPAPTTQAPPQQTRPKPTKPRPTRPTKPKDVTGDQPQGGGRGGGVRGNGGGTGGADGTGGGTGGA